MIKFTFGLIRNSIDKYVCRVFENLPVFVLPLLTNTAINVATNTPNCILTWRNPTLITKLIFARS